LIRYYITDRRAAGGVEELVEIIERRMAEGVDMIQLREKDLNTRELFTLTERVVRLSKPHGAKVLVNARVDVALASGAAGVHLRAGSIAPERLREITPPDFVLGVSCHTIEEVQAAQEEGAGFVVFSPVFPSSSKEFSQEPKGLKGLRAAVEAVRIPVLALGGVTVENAHLCVQAGAAGVAGISMFQRAERSAIRE